MRLSSKVARYFNPESSGCYAEMLDRRQLILLLDYLQDVVIPGIQQETATPMAADSLIAQGNPK